MENFNFNKDFFKTCREIEDEAGTRTAAALAWALLCYGYESRGIETALESIPKRNRLVLRTGFNLAKGRIDAMIAGALGAKRRGQKPDPNRPPREGSKPDPSRGAKPDPSLQKEKEKEKEKERVIGGGALELSDGYQITGQSRPTPTAEEVETYFQTNMLRGSAAEFFDYYAAQGWKRGNGLAIEDWKAQARQWGRRQRVIDAERKAEGRQTSQEIERVSTWKPAEAVNPFGDPEKILADIERRRGAKT